MGLTNLEYKEAVNLERKVYEKFSPEEVRELSVLNLGAGTCGSFVSIHIRNIPFFELINVEIFEPYYQVLQQTHYQTRLIRNYNEDLTQHLGLYESNPARTVGVLRCYDIIFMIDVIEHLSRSTAHEFLERLALAQRETIKKKAGKFPRLLLFVPIGLCPQEAYDGNEYQRHLSTWELNDFKDYEVEYHPTLHGSFGAAWVWI